MSQRTFSRDDCRFRLFGPPGIVFFDASGREIEGLRVVGYQSPEKFIKSLDLALR